MITAEEARRLGAGNNKYAEAVANHFSEMIAALAPSGKRSLFILQSDPDGKIQDILRNAGYEVETNNGHIVKIAW